MPKNSSFAPEITPPKTKITIIPYFSEPTTPLPPPPPKTEIRQKSAVNTDTFDRGRTTSRPDLPPPTPALN